MNIHIRTLTLSLAVFLIFGCTTPSKRISSPDVIKTAVFPDGIYQHDVALQIHGKEGEKQNNHFRGVVKLKPEAIQIVSLSPFGTTVFKIIDDRVARKVDKEIYVEEMKPYANKIIEYYIVLKAMLLAERDPLAKGFQMIQVNPDTTIRFDHYDSNHIPGLANIHSPQFDADIKITGYDL
jgi:hypothetical protein